MLITRWFLRLAARGIATVLLLLRCEGARAAEYRVVRSEQIAVEPACMPALTRAANGDLLVAFSTEWEPFPWGGVLKRITSRDNGRSWSAPVLLWKDQDPRVTIQVSNGMQTLSNGEVLLPVTWCIVPKREGVSAEEKRPSVIYDWKVAGYRLEVRLLRSKDHGKTWTIEDPKLGGPWFRFGRLLETRDGRLIMAGDGAWYIETRDFGTTWGPRITVDSSFNETNIVQAADGTLFALMRQDGELGVRRMFGTSFSRDGGKTWDRWRWAGVQGKMPDLLTLPSGRILLAVGAEGLTDGSQVMTTKTRNSFSTLFISDDNGQSWNRDLPFAPITPDSSIVPSDSPVMCPLGEDRILVVIQGIDRAQAGNRLLGFGVGMSLIANVIEPSLPLR